MIMLYLYQTVMSIINFIVIISLVVQDLTCIIKILTTSCARSCGYDLRSYQDLTVNLIFLYLVRALSRSYMSSHKILRVCLQDLINLARFLLRHKILPRS